MNSCLLKTKRGNVQKGLEKVQKVRFLSFKERESFFSLYFRPFGPSVLDGVRSKVVIRDEGYAWTSIWWSSDNSKTYGSFPTCVILWLRAM